MPARRLRAMVRRPSHVKFWARVGYSVALLVVATLPFDPLLNTRSLVFPVSLVAVVLGLVSMYVSTLPDERENSRTGGAR